ncbi:hypothetical protein ACFY2T_37295 [Streptomyces sp. NPDC001260]|uniref:hypothetical protein n=1 Tax=Streptomyces sp. NPDC001260 TaxID=3364551 RepID=UPI00367D2C06
MTEQTEQQPMAVPPMPEAPPVQSQPPVQPEPQPPVKKDRRVLRAVLRWTAAVTAFAAVGAGTAYGITGMQRTDLPGLATQSDGRWDYPTLTKPPLPSGSPEPFAESNTAGTHYADLRALLLPAPKGAVADGKLRGTDGWLATKDFLAEYAQKETRDNLKQSFTDDGLRHIAARGWTTPDGTHTRVYLLQFGTAAVVDDLFSSEAPADGPTDQLRGTITSVFDRDFPSEAHDYNVQYSAYVETTPYGAEQTRQAYLSAGDVLAVIVQSRKGKAKPVPFRQTVALQSQLLG